MELSDSPLKRTDRRILPISFPAHSRHLEGAFCHLRSRDPAFKSLGATNPMELLAAFQMIMTMDFPSVVDSHVTCFEPSCVVDCGPGKRSQAHGLLVASGFAHVSVHATKAPQTQPVQTPGSVIAVAPETAVAHKSETSSMFDQYLMVINKFIDSEKKLTPESNISELGVSSAMMTALSQELAEAAGVNLPPTLVFDYPIVQDLVEYVLRAAGQKEEEIVADADVGGSQGEQKDGTKLEARRIRRRKRTQSFLNHGYAAYARPLPARKFATHVRTCRPARLRSSPEQPRIQSITSSLQSISTASMLSVRRNISTAHLSGVDSELNAYYQRNIRSIQSLQPTNVGEGCTGQFVDAATLYNKIQGQGVAYGPMFRAIGQAATTPECAMVASGSAQGAEAWANSLAFNPARLDGLTQTAALLGGGECSEVQTQLGGAQVVHASGVSMARMQRHEPPPPPSLYLVEWTPVKSTAGLLDLEFESSEVEDVASQLQLIRSHWLQTSTICIPSPLCGAQLRAAHSMKYLACKLFEPTSCTKTIFATTSLLPSSVLKNSSQISAVFHRHSTPLTTEVKSVDSKLQSGLPTLLKSEKSSRELVKYCIRTKNPSLGAAQDAYKIASFIRGNVGQRQTYLPARKALTKTSAPGVLSLPAQPSKGPSTSAGSQEVIAVSVQQETAPLPEFDRKTAQATLSELVLFFIDTDSVDADAPLMDVGLDSLTMMEFRSKLSQQLGMALPSIFLFDYPTIADIVDYMSEQASQKERERAAVTTTPTTTKAPTESAPVEVTELDASAGLAPPPKSRATARVTRRSVGECDQKQSFGAAPWSSEREKTIPDLHALSTPTSELSRLSTSGIGTWRSPTSTHAMSHVELHSNLSQESSPADGLFDTHGILASRVGSQVQCGGTFGKRLFSRTSFMGQMPDARPAQTLQEWEQRMLANAVNKVCNRCHIKAPIRPSSALRAQCFSAHPRHVGHRLGSMLGTNAPLARSCQQMHANSIGSLQCNIRSCLSGRQSMFARHRFSTMHSNTVPHESCPQPVCSQVSSNLTCLPDPAYPRYLSQRLHSRLSSSGLHCRSHPASSLTSAPLARSCQPMHANSIGSLQCSHMTPLRRSTVTDQPFTANRVSSRRSQSFHASSISSTGFRPFSPLPAARSCTFKPSTIESQPCKSQAGLTFYKQCHANSVAPARLGALSARPASHICASSALAEEGATSVLSRPCLSQGALMSKSTGAQMISTSRPYFNPISPASLRSFSHAKLITNIFTKCAPDTSLPPRLHEDKKESEVKEYIPGSEQEIAYAKYLNTVAGTSIMTPLASRMRWRNTQAEDSTPGALPRLSKVAASTRFQTLKAIMPADYKVEEQAADYKDGIVSWTTKWTPFKPIMPDHKVEEKVRREPSTRKNRMNKLSQPFHDLFNEREFCPDIASITDDMPVIANCGTSMHACHITALLEAKAKAERSRRSCTTHGAKFEQAPTTYTNRAILETQAKRHNRLKRPFNHIYPQGVRPVQCFIRQWQEAPKARRPPAAGLSAPQVLACSQVVATTASAAVSNLSKLATARWTTRFPAKPLPCQPSRTMNYMMPSQASDNCFVARCYTKFLRHDLMPRIIAQLRHLHPAAARSRASLSLQHKPVQAGLSNSLLGDFDSDAALMDSGLQSTSGLPRQPFPPRQLQHIEAHIPSSPTSHTANAPAYGRLLTRTSIHRCFRQDSLHDSFSDDASLCNAGIPSFCTAASSLADPLQGRNFQPVDYTATHFVRNDIDEPQLIPSGSLKQMKAAMLKRGGYTAQAASSRLFQPKAITYTIPKHLSAYTQQQTSAPSELPPPDTASTSPLQALEDVSEAAQEVALFDTPDDVLALVEQARVKSDIRKSSVDVSARKPLASVPWQELVPCRPRARDHIRTTTFCTENLPCFPPPLSTYSHDTSVLARRVRSSHHLRSACTNSSESRL